MSCSIGLMLILGCSREESGGRFALGSLPSCVCCVFPDRSFLLYQTAIFHSINCVGFRRRAKYEYSDISREHTSISLICL